MLNETSTFMPSAAAKSLATATLRDPRWAAVVARDRSFDGQFVYSVRTTGVYCHPSCGARPARPENVAFHADPAAATRAGFRACKRCRPDEAPLAERRAALIAELCRYLERTDEAPSLEALADRAGLSVHHLHRTFKAVTGVTPRAYVAAARARKVQEELAARDTVTEAIYGAGYNSSGRFYAATDAMLGMTPSSWKRGGADVAIRFAIAECSLGSVLVAASDRGVCAILLGDDPEALAHDLERRFPRAELVGADADFERTVAAVIALVEHPRTDAELPLDVRGTAFQQRVWQALRAIPAGTTASYAEIARAIGKPHAARAVAQACAENPLAIAIPCHRVVRTDGKLSGYRWGVERKRAILAREARRP